MSPPAAARVPGRRGLAPARVIVVAFGAAVAVGTLLLLLPVASEPGVDTTAVDALFTATSAVSVTGLVVTDTATHWSAFGEVVILVLVQLGGFGIMTLSSLVALVLSRRLGLRRRLVAQTETSALNAGDVRRVVIGVAVISAVVEGVTALVLTWRFHTDTGSDLLESLWLGVFHAVTAFNNAGFALFSDNLVGFVDDWWLCIVISVAIIAGGLGFPVYDDLSGNLRRPKRWSLHTKLTLGTTAVLLVGGTALIAASEWTNPGTLGALDGPDRLLASWFASVNPRTAGFNSLDYGLMREGTLLVTDGLMFIGAGSASTAGGIKVTTFALLGFVAWAEVRGDPDVNAFGRRVPGVAQRQAVTMVLLATGTVMVATLSIMVLSDIGLSSALFEAVSAFGTVGLSTGVTPELGSPSQLILSALMFAGRIGPITLFAALVIREHGRLYRFPEERPIVG